MDRGVPAASDGLVVGEETASVEFKRALSVDTAGQKAACITDVLGLVHAQASGRRLMITGFDEKTRRYAGPPDPRLTHNRLEQLLAHSSTRAQEYATRLDSMPRPAPDALSAAGRTGRRRP